MGDCLPHPFTLQSGILSPRNFLPYLRATSSLQVRPGRVNASCSLLCLAFQTSEICVGKALSLPLEDFLEILD